MNLTPVKTAEGRRLRHPKTKAVLPNVTDEGVDAVSVNLADPHWYKALRRGDIELADPETKPDWLRDLDHVEPAPEEDEAAPKADAAPAKAALPTPAKVAAPAAAPIAAADAVSPTKPA